jgi:hypothetical protein
MENGKCKDKHGGGKGGVPADRASRLAASGDEVAVTEQRNNLQ